MASAVTSKEFDKKVLDSKGLVLVDFWAAWCPPCHALAPIIEQISEEIKDTKVYKLNVDEERDIAMRYQITSIPTTKLFKDGEEVETFIGLAPKQHFLELIKKHS
jgi:thioredoxin 1